jgi:hypothetical protein
MRLGAWDRTARIFPIMTYTMQNLTGGRRVPHSLRHGIILPLLL